MPRECQFVPDGFGKVGQTEPRHETLEGVSKGPEDPVSLPGDPGAPVHQGTENVKEHRPNGGHGRRSNPVFRAGLAPVLPRKIMAKSLIKWRERRDSNPRPLP